ncbi:hypothetical protein BU24DRAFT_389853 [Aaosphaeria arxii CBS 175.79]|uniref:G-patch domain-containing protein n=1 Tax=Aaosphaeria arxii CBS 175.79 TaxID=1450172 RepID=A0A6A5XYS9_9PLEO|nr:uncharacterized protein BU24DRAFT_389853 [Aaosphaeria arxii CBS 175.79]KAF2018136.1 hypothetical protein BU24DRAFT_389853 [Aaosphaeria arxii CBS 175.79]
MSSQQNKPPGGLPNPYASGGLPNPYALPDPAAAPAKLTEEQVKAEEKKRTANMFHNPHMIKRPQAKAANVIKKPIAPKPALPAMPTTTSVDHTPRPVQHSIDYYRNTVDDDNDILEAKREAEREKKQAMKDQKKFKQKFGNWNPNDQYRLKQTTNIAAYKASGEYNIKLNMFRDYLRQARRDFESTAGADKKSTSPQKPQLSPDLPISDDHVAQLPQSPRNSSPHVNLSEAETGNEAYERRLGLSQSQSLTVNSVESGEGHPKGMEASNLRADTSEGPGSLSAPSKITNSQPDDAIQRQVRLAQQRAQQLAAAIPPPPPPSRAAPETQEAIPPPPPPPPPPAPYSATISGAPVHYSSTISAAPVHYARPDVVMKDAEETTNTRPAKKQKTESKPTKAELMMSKMGYKKGQGLGKNNDGITTHLEVRRRKEPNGGRQQNNDDFDFDNDSGGVKAPKPQEVFDITGGRQVRPKEQSKWGEPSRVVIAWGCVDGIDFSEDADREDGGIRQEMGDTFDQKFGSVERIHINMSSDSKPVYIAFRDALSALNAVNRFSGGYLFRDRPIRAQFYDEKRFNDFDYEH